LFDVVNDPGERHDLASSMPEMLASMRSRLHVIQKTFWAAPMMPDNGKFCAQMRENGGFYGPWIQ